MKKYDASNIQVLTDILSVRQCYGMYIGDNGTKGLHHLIWEIVDNSVDEAMAGHCNTILVKIDKDGKTVSVEDNGRGIPVDEHPTEKKSALEIVLTVLHAGGKFDGAGSGYVASGGLHGVGASCVNALSTVLVAEVNQDGNLYSQTYDRGTPRSKVKKIRSLEKKQKPHGTKITWLADDTIFTKVQYDDQLIVRRLRETAFLNKGLRIEYSNENTNINEVFHFNGGIVDYIKYLAEAKAGLYPSEPIYGEYKTDMTTKTGQMQVNIALLYSDEDDESILSFCNNINTSDGGTHVSGFKTALTRVVNTFAKNLKLVKETAPNLSGDDIREGLSAILTVRIPRPEFVSQTKTKLGTVEAESIVSAATMQILTSYFDKNAAVIKKIVERALIAQEARSAAKKSSELIKRKGFLSKSNRMPGKLYDCNSEKRELSELFIVEGDSAAGCFSGDTLVSLADGREISLIEEDKLGKVNFCYSIDENQNICIKKILNPRWTKKCSKWLKITLDNDCIIECTLDHKFMILNGTYTQAKDLNIGDSLNPLYRKVKSIEVCENEMNFYDLEVEDTHNFALSAGVFVHNSGKDGRDPEFQAILPIRGKIINAEKKDIASLLKNKEIQSLIIAIGTGIKEDFDIERLRYNKIIVMADADVDGAHIATLLMTFFYRYMKQLVVDGHVYLAQPPLYCIDSGKNKIYCWTEEELKENVKKLGKVKVVRFKGLGEMDAEQLADTTMNTMNRRLIKLNGDDQAECERMVSILMGSNVQFRKDHIASQVNSVIKRN
jgi:DNA gyrase subunit B